MGNTSAAAAQPSPVQVTGLSGVSSIGGGYVHSRARTSDGAVWTWGDNSYGQLGTENRAQSTTAVQAGVASITQVAASGNLYSRSRRQPPSDDDVRL